MLLLIVLEPEMKQESWTESEKEGKKKKTHHTAFAIQEPKANRPPSVPTFALVGDYREVSSSGQGA